MNSGTEQICCNCDARTLPGRFPSTPTTTHFQFHVGGATAVSPPLPAVCQRLPMLGRCHRRHRLRKSVGSGPGQLPPLPNLESGGCAQGATAISRLSEGCSNGTGALEVTGAWNQGWLHRGHIWNASALGAQVPPGRVHLFCLCQGLTPGGGQRGEGKREKQGQKIGE